MCSLDFFCPGGAPQQCTTNSTTLGNPGSMQSSDCKCVAGFYKHANGQCLPCERGSFCIGDKQLPCPSNSSAPALAKSVVECVCDAGLRIHTGECVACNASQLCRDGIVTDCAQVASVVNFFCMCAAGTYCPGGNLSCTGEPCIDCPQNHWCVDNIALQCVANSFAPARSSAHSQCRCVDGFYHQHGACVECPLHHICFNESRRAVAEFDHGLRTLATRTVLLEDAVCAPGMFRTWRTDMCKPCPRNFFCPSESVMGLLPNVVRCVENQFTYDTGAESSSQCVCLAGFKMILDDESVQCRPCTVGQRCKGGSVVEELCHLQNKVASANHDMCVCNSGFGMLNFECTECTPGFVKPTAGDTQCTACADATYDLN
jgi:hypothetical protein